MLLEGLHIPLTTPFHPDGRLNAHKLVANVIRYSKSPAQGLIALAPTAGEPTLLDDEEKRAVLRTVSEATAHEKVLLANVSCDSVRSTLALAQTAADLAYDVLLLSAPSVLRADTATLPGLNHREALVYFRSVADRAPLPMLIASTPALQLWPETIAELATHPNILGLLDATGSPAASWASALVRTTTGTIRREVTVTPTFTPVTGRMLRGIAASSADVRQSAALVSAASLTRNPAASATAVAPPAAAPAIRTRTKTVGFQVLAASAPHLLESLTEGATGIAPSFAACAPQACYEVFAAWKDGDQPLALEKQQRIRAASEFADRLGPAALKFGCDLNGYFGGPPRLPHLPLTADQRSALQLRMSSLRT